MELHPIQASQWPWFHPIQYFLQSQRYASVVPENHVRWTQTAEAHLFAADLPGVPKEEIRVEIEDSRYMVIRTEESNHGEDQTHLQRRFMRKFRLPRLVDLEGVSAGFTDGVLTVTVPRSIIRGRLRISTSDIPEDRNSVAAAA